MHPVRSAFRKLIAIDWRGVFVNIAIIVPILALLALVISWYFRLPALAHFILDPFFRAGEWCYGAYHTQRGLFTTGTIGLVLVLAGLAGWYYIVVEPRREKQRKWANQIDYIERVINDSDLMAIWVKEGTPEQSHAERAGNKSAN